MRQSKDILVLLTIVFISLDKRSTCQNNGVQNIGTNKLV